MCPLPLYRSILICCLYISIIWEFHVCIYVFCSNTTPTYSPSVPLLSPIGGFSLINTSKFATLKQGVYFKKKSLILTFHYVSVCASVYGLVDVGARICRSQKRLSDPPVLKWEAVLSHPTWVLGSELGSCRTEASTFSCLDISPARAENNKQTSETIATP